jgi:hypothetical protein
MVTGKSFPDSQSSCRKKEERKKERRRERKQQINK